jgi:hypothetical protein
VNVRSPGLWIGVFSLLAVLGVALVDMRQTSPGPLATAHGRVPELNGRAGCAECHGGLMGGMTQACLDCHAVVADQIELGDGLHGAVEAERARLCSLCHSEHHGAEFELVNRASFAQVGAPSVKEFDHGLVGWEMAGAHLELDCSECHENADLDVLPEGALRFIGLDQDCATCHEDSHQGALGRDCATCHGQESATEDLHFSDHDRWLPLIGGHAEATCRDCHAAWTPRSLEVLRAGAGPERARGCLACHESPHDETFVERVAARVEQPRAQSCRTCHEAEHETFDDEDVEVSDELHACSGFQLIPPHEEVSCDACHAPEADGFPARYPGRSPWACVDCHDDPHDGQFGDGPFARVGCIACHAATRFEPHTFDVPKHERTAMPLTGAHVETACEECHRAPSSGGPRVFRGTGFRCESCHTDAHRGFFGDFAAELAEMETGDCARCHGTGSFDVPDELFDHGRWTDFPLRGAHAQAQCAACHRDSEEPDANGRTFGFVGEVLDTYERGVGCDGCHVDPHQGGFDDGLRPAVVDGREDCARCHDETSFRALPYGFHHGRWTGFQLGLAHGKLACSECHPPLRPADEHGRIDGVADCGRCHDNNLQTFTENVFLHNRDSRFLLNEAHEALECSACHFPVSVGDREVIRYRPLGRECVDCHGDQADVMLRRQREMSRRRR